MMGGLKMSFAHDWSSTVRAARSFGKADLDRLLDEAVRTGRSVRDQSGTGSPRIRDFRGLPSPSSLSPRPQPSRVRSRLQRPGLPPAIRFLAPSAAELPVGQTRIEVEVAGAQPGDEMDFFVDGRKVGNVAKPPGRSSGRRAKRFEPT